MFLFIHTGTVIFHIEAGAAGKAAAAPVAAAAAPVAAPGLLIGMFYRNFFLYDKKRWWLFFVDKWMIMISWNIRLEKFNLVVWETAAKSACLREVLIIFINENQEKLFCSETCRKMFLRTTTLWIRIVSWVQRNHTTETGKWR